MNFDIITIDSFYIIFNNTGFYITSENDISISLVYINSDISTAGDGDKVLEFNADTTSGTVWFNISGFPVGNSYVIKRDGNEISTPTANSSGFISFSNNVWSLHQFEIFQDGEASGDIISPQISNIEITLSNQIDTEADFGWENITCTVTDNVGVDTVSVNITYPNATTIKQIMTNIIGSDQYYYNISFSQYGNYSYYIWADDTSNNTDISSISSFSLPPNWDIDNDGSCNVFDYVLISNHYGETGSAGWIREDVDNNGQIQVFDLVMVSTYYSVTWWE